MRETVALIKKMMQLPISLIIIGVGDEDFKNMIALDDDRGLLQTQIDEQNVKRDVVQFVPFRKFGKSDVYGLARETLSEIPMQFLDYYKMKHILPRNWPPKEMKK